MSAAGGRPPALGQLFTFASGARSADRATERALAHGLPVMLDSGAWSVKTGAASITLDEHTDFVLERQDREGWGDVRFVGLDVIGDHHRTLENFLEQTDAGAAVEPTIHYGTDPALARDFADNLQTEWVNLGGLVQYQRGSDHRTQAAWCAAVRRNLPSGVKLHGLGAVTPPLNADFPFASVDSTYWQSPVRLWRSLPLFDTRTGKWRGYPTHTDEGRVEATLRAAYKGAKFLRSQYALEPEVLPTLDCDGLLELSFISHRRFVEHFRRRHDSDLVAYMAASESYSALIAKAVA